MQMILTIARRELGTYGRTASGAIVVALCLMIDGLLFNAVAVGGGAKLSSEVLEAFFYCASGTTMLAAVFISMRLLAEDRQNGSLVLLSTSCATDWQVVLGKYLAAWVFLAGATLMTAYMPVLVLVHGKVSIGHVLAGYLGLLLLGGATLALGLLCSALASSQLVAAIASAATVTVALLMWLLSQIASPPLAGLLAYLALHERHFRPFMRGLVSSADVVFYVSLTAVALLGATRALEVRRWR